MRHFPSYFRFPHNSEQKFRAPRKISPIWSFSQKKFRFSSAKISDDIFLVVHHKFRISPYFPYFNSFPPYFGKFLFPLLLQNSLLIFGKLTCFTYFRCISFPPTFTMMHLCITQCTYWTPLLTRIYSHTRSPS